MYCTVPHLHTDKDAYYPYVRVQYSNSRARTPLSVFMILVMVNGQYIHCTVHLFKVWFCTQQSIYAIVYQVKQCFASYHYRRLCNCSGKQKSYRLDKKANVRNWQPAMKNKNKNKKGKVVITFDEDSRRSVSILRSLMSFALILRQRYNRILGSLQERSYNLIKNCTLRLIYAREPVFSNNIFMGLMRCKTFGSRS